MTLPIGSDLYWVGSTYEWEKMELKVTEAARLNLEKQIQDTIKMPFQIIEQKVGIRPTVKDRRPVLGRHPHHSSLYIFNGLGSKGVSMAPVLSKELVDHFILGSPIHEECNIGRFN